MALKLSTFRAFAQNLLFFPENNANLRLIRANAQKERSMAMSISKDINVVVRARRKELGLTQSQLAELAGVSSRFVFDLEAGKQTVALDRVLLVLKVLGLKLNLRVSSDA